MSKKRMTVRICSACGQHVMHRENAPVVNCCFAHTWTDLKMTKGARQLDVTWLLLVKCPHCSALLWIEEQEKAYKINPKGTDGVSADTDIINIKPYAPTFGELMRFERADVNEKKHEKYAQIRAWMMVQTGEANQSEETGFKDEQIGMAEKFKEAKPGLEPTFMEYMDFLSAGVHDEEKEVYLRLHAWWAGNDPRRLGGPSMPMTPLEQANLRAFLPYLNERRFWEQLLKAEIFRELGEFAEAEKLLATPVDGSNIVRECLMHIHDLNRKQSTSVSDVTAMYINPDLVGIYIIRCGLTVLTTSRH